MFGNDQSSSSGRKTDSKGSYTVNANVQRISWCDPKKKHLPKLPGKREYRNDMHILLHNQLSVDNDPIGILPSPSGLLA